MGVEELRFVRRAGLLCGRLRRLRVRVRLLRFGFGPGERHRSGRRSQHLEHRSTIGFHVGQSSYLVNRESLIVNRWITIL